MPFNTPYYKCAIEDKTYTVDVTLSAPPQTQRPSPIIEDLINYLQEARVNGKQIKRICDFGAGKLRNIRSLIKKGFTVYAVEYGEQFQPNSASEQMLDTLRKDYKKQFKKLIFPSEFQDSSVEFDAVLLIFVTHIIPYPEDRHHVIKCCAEKLKKGGLLFWTTPYGDTNMRRLCNDKYKYRDGWLFHIQDTRQTFYTEFKVSQIDNMILNHGFDFVKRLEFYKNPARIYVKK
jgi:2-polyprenyl-3-methyl-5-hydroxy-6-metoxy-1,4-benzoquinol methylase